MVQICCVAAASRPREHIRISALNSSKGRLTSARSGGGPFGALRALGGGWAGRRAVHCSSTSLATVFFDRSPPRLRTRIPLRGGHARCWSERAGRLDRFMYLERPLHLAVYVWGLPLARIAPTRPPGAANAIIARVGHLIRPAAGSKHLGGPVDGVITPCAGTRWGRAFAATWRLAGGRSRACRYSFDQAEPGVRVGRGAAAVGTLVESAAHRVCLERTVR